MQDVLNKMLCMCPDSLKHIMVQYQSGKCKFMWNLFCYHYQGQWVSWSNSLYKVIFVVIYVLLSHLPPTSAYNTYLKKDTCSCISEFFIVPTFHNSDGILSFSQLKILLPLPVSFFFLVCIFLPLFSVFYLPRYILESSR